MEIVIPRGAGKQVQPEEEFELTFGRRKMLGSWSTDGTSFRVTSNPTGTKKGAAFEIGNAFVLVRAYKEDQNGNIEWAEPIPVYTADTETIDEPKLKEFIEEALTALNNYRDSKPDKEETPQTDIASLL